MVLPDQRRRSRRQRGGHARSARVCVVVAVDAPQRPGVQDVAAATDDVRARRGDVGLYAPVVARAAAAERRHPARVVRDEVAADRLGRVIAGPRARCPRYLIAPGRPERLAGPHRNDVLGAGGRIERILVNDAVRVRVQRFVARREQHRHIRVVPDELVGFRRIRRVASRRVGPPAVRVDARPRCIRLGKQIVEVGGQSAQTPVRVENALKYQIRFRRDARERPRVALRRRVRPGPYPRAEHRSRHVSPMPVRVVRQAGAAQSERRGHAALEVGAERGAVRADVEACVRHGNRLPAPEHARILPHRRNSDETARHVVRQLRRHPRLDPAHARQPRHPVRHCARRFRHKRAAAFAARRP